MKNLSDADSPYLLSKVQKAEEKGYIKKPTLLLIQHFHKNYKAQIDHEEDEDYLKFKNKNNSKCFQKFIQKFDIKETAKSIDQYYSRYQSLLQNNQSYKSEFEQYLNETIRKKQKRIDEEVIGKNGNKQNSNHQKETNINNGVEQKQQALQTYIQQQDIASQRDKEIIQKAIQNLNQSQSIQSAQQTQSQNDRKDSQNLKGQDYFQNNQIQVMEPLSIYTQENSQSVQQIDTKNINQDYSQIQGGKQMIKGNNLPFKIKKQRDVQKKSRENQIIGNNQQNEADQIHKDLESNSQQNNKIIDKNPLKGADKQTIKHNMQNNQNQVTTQNQNEYSQEYYQHSYYDNQYYQQYPQQQIWQQDQNQLLFDPQSLPQDLYQEFIFCENLQKKLIDDIMNKNYNSDGLNMDEKIQQYLSRKNMLEERLKPFQQRQNYSEYEAQKIVNYDQENALNKNKEDSQIQNIRNDSKELKEQKIISNSKHSNNNKESPTGIYEKRQAIITAGQQPQQNQKGNLSKKQKLYEGNSLEDNYQQQQLQKMNYSQNEQTYSDSSNKESKIFSGQKNEAITKEKASQKQNGKNDFSQQNKISNKNFNQLQNTLQLQINSLGYQNQPHKMPYNKYNPFIYESQQYTHHPNYPHHQPPPPYTSYEKSHYYQHAYQPPTNHIPQQPHNSQSQIKPQQQQPPPYIIPHQQQIPPYKLNYSSNMYPPQVMQQYPQYQYNGLQNENIQLQNYNKQQQIQKQQLHQQPNIDNEYQSNKLQNSQGLLSSKETMQLKNLSDIKKQINNSQREEIRITESSESDVQLIEDHQKIIQEIKN